ncbi:MAG: hypothetical protein DWQ07_22545 [Chloroflexi bacterium]|nr:MAG: hypothetical protein DWQ07_22545 [Chloroflexota bacterium]MBL1193928.1 hypothetical protein [Chloroflexota bacterium]NOH11222.1 hypothetical protein [Chloroflexota bacterium]
MMRKDILSILGMAMLLGIACGLDSLTDLLNSGFENLSIHGLTLTWALLGIQLFFAVLVLALVWFVLGNGELSRISAYVFIATGLLILLAASPPILVWLAEFPTEQFPRSVLTRWPIFRVEATQRIVEAAAFILVTGVIRLGLRQSQS